MIHVKEQSVANARNCSPNFTLMATGTWVALGILAIGILSLTAAFPLRFPALSTSHSNLITKATAADAVENFLAGPAAHVPGWLSIRNLSDVTVLLNLSQQLLGAKIESDRWRQRALAIPTMAADATLSRPRPTVNTLSLINQLYTLPISFEVNRGQTNAQVKFLSRGKGYTLFLNRTEAVMLLRRPGPRVTDLGAARALGAHREAVAGSALAVLRMELVGASPAHIAGSQELPGKSNYFIGNDPKKWLTNVPTYAQVKYRSVYPGMDLVYYGSQQQLEHDFVLAPGADPKAIRVRFSGADQLSLNAEGNAVIEIAGAQVILRAPVIYQEGDRVRQTVEGHYLLRGRNELGFAVAPYDAHKTLIIDPVLAYSTYLGGNGTDVGNAIAVDDEGNAYVTGSTNSMDFPTTLGAFQTTFGGGLSDAFVSKLNKNGLALLYSTYLGGSGTDEGHGIAVDGEGNAYVTGFTNSANFPTTHGAFQRTFSGVSNAFVTKLNKLGSAPVYSTYLGGSGGDKGNAIAVNREGNAYVAGSTNSMNFPTFRPFQGTISIGSVNAFVTKLNQHGSALVYSTYLGGSVDDEALGIAVDEEQNAYVTGFASSANFPIASALQPNMVVGAVTNAFVTKLNQHGSALVYSTYLGGSVADAGNGIAVDGEGNAYVTGLTSSTDFPTTLGAFQTTFGGAPNDAFVSKLNQTGSALIYSTYLGGGGDDQGNGIAVDGQGNAYVTGSTNSIPPASPFQGTFGGGNSDAFVSKLNQNGSALVFSTYLGGGGNDVGLGITVDGESSAYVTGLTSSANFPTTPGAFQTSLGGGNSDAFVSKISQRRRQVEMEEEEMEENRNDDGSRRERDGRRSRD